MLKKSLVLILLSSGKYQKRQQMNLSSFFFCLLVWKLLRKWHFRWNFGKKWTERVKRIKRNLFYFWCSFDSVYFFVNCDEICCIRVSGIQIFVENLLCKKFKCLMSQVCKFFLNRQKLSKTYKTKETTFLLWVEEREWGGWELKMMKILKKEKNIPWLE